MTDKLTVGRIVPLARQPVEYPEHKGKISVSHTLLKGLRDQAVRQKALLEGQKGRETGLAYLDGQLSILAALGVGDE